MGGNRTLDNRNVQVVSGPHAQHADTFENRRPRLGLSAITILPGLLKVLESFRVPCPQAGDQLVVERRFHAAILNRHPMSAMGGKRTLSRAEASRLFRSDIEQARRSLFQVRVIDNYSNLSPESILPGT